MLKKLFFIIALFLINFQTGISQEVHPLDKMLISKQTPVVLLSSSPIEQRDEEYRKFLAPSVKIFVPDSENKGSSGSGTIIYYDSDKKLAYVASCGHLWPRGTMSVNQESYFNKNCKIIVWYKNNKKLEKSETFDATLLFYSYLPGQDTSLIVFTPNWEPKYFPIGPENYIYETGRHVHSTGSDLSQETAHYDVSIVGSNGSDLVTQFNSPRPGRSGGGLMDDDDYYIGTCWGTEFVNGSGKGFFTPLSSIHKFWRKQNGYSFLLEQNLARQIVIIDKNYPQKHYPTSYILMPSR
jgi:hypothetical protein